ncbi:MAG TPA: hypothetical protein VNI79_01905 [Sphingomicrobium sp.]|nr:hypothetical protein [Sphingomicrobium sp.]
MIRALSIAGLAVALASCGQVAPLRPLPGKTLPVKPLVATETPSVNDLLAITPMAKPARTDELLTRSQPRRADRFDLPPADGGAAPTEREPTAPAPSTTGPDNVREPR